jgi:hypothetical protein
LESLAPRFRSEAFSILDGTTVSDGPIEFAWAIEIVFEKAAIREAAFDKENLREGRTAKDAFFETALNEVGLGEKSPIPLGVLEGAADEIRINDSALDQ